MPQPELLELEKEHQALERELEDELSHPFADSLHLAELKRRKLHVKDEMVRLQAREEGDTLH
ncbi:MAG TPA: DUF465 domain-containing protein [Hyphomicrobiales bacterium]|nr:DUF465 domain-containing protein [Hyphomicrobiales bacterium]